MTDIDTKTRVTFLTGSEKIPIQDKDGDFNYTTPVDFDAAVRTAWLGTFAKWDAAKARATTAPPRVLFAGDSNVMGQGANSGATRFTKGFARDFADQMGWLTGSILGSQMRAVDSIAAYETYNPAVSHSGGWTVDAGGNPATVGGNMFKASTAGTLTWTSVEEFDKIRIWYPRASGLNASVTVTVDGSLLDTFSQSGAAAILFKDYTFSHGTHVVAIGCSGSGDAYLTTIEAWDTTNGTPVYLQGGWYGSGSADHIKTVDAWSALNQYNAMDPDFVFYYCNINDMITPTTLNTYYDNIESFVENMSSTADGCLFVGFPCNKTAQRNGYGLQQAETLRRIAQDYGWSFLDYRPVLGHSFNRANDRGYAYDNDHPSQAGHDLMADTLFAFLGDRLA